MELQLSKRDVKTLNALSKSMKLKKEELLSRALHIYMDDVINYQALKKEIKAWDALSEETLQNLEKSQL
ncbi:hypothetical protein CMO92_05075 [Candidatus Woesearchaeota archaeon]|nr:hypothetical protein [Candidatus Woesearchaeota archaeon]